MNEIIYLDNNATTPVDQHVLDAMLPFLTTAYGNAASNHEFGVAINQHVKEARMSLADLIGCEPKEIIFTSGATEAINLALRGTAELNTHGKKHFVTVETEHPAILDTCKYLEQHGFEITYIPVDTNGLLDLERVDASIRPDTLLLSVMFANNETGVIQPIEKLSRIAHAKGALFMTDGTQAVGKTPIDVDTLGIDLMSFSAHKFYGPKGVGGLFIRSRRPNKVKLHPLIYGGGHERGLRSGTLNVPGIIGIGKAAELAKAEMSKNKKHIEELRNQLEQGLLQISATFLNGDVKNRIYNTSNICFGGVDADAIMTGMKGIMVSNGSACTSMKVEPSHVLKAMGKTDLEAYGSIRFSLGKYNTLIEVEHTIRMVSSIVAKLRAMVTT